MRIAVALVILALGASVASSAVLTAPQLKEKVVGKTCTWVNGKASGTSNYAADGSASVTVSGAANIGTWRLKGNQICDKFKDMRQGKESCFTFDETSPGSYKGSIGFTATCN
jgi:hypothetical protein